MYNRENTYDVIELASTPNDNYEVVIQEVRINARASNNKQNNIMSSKHGES